MAYGKFILAITWGKTINDSTDEWMVFDTYAQAAKKYAELIKRPLCYSATIALIVQSTDYVGEGTVIGDQMCVHYSERVNNWQCGKDDCLAIDCGSFEDMKEVK